MMIIRDFGSDAVYLDERYDEFSRVLMVLSGFGTIGFMLMVFIPFCYLNHIVDMGFLIVGALAVVGISVYAIWNGFATPPVYYDVWISGEHRRIDKTGTDIDKVLVSQAADELEGILRERIKFGREIRK